MDLFQLPLGSFMVLYRAWPSQAQQQHSAAGDSAQCTTSTYRMRCQLWS